MLSRLFFRCSTRLLIPDHVYSCTAVVGTAMTSSVYVSPFISSLFLSSCLLTVCLSASLSGREREREKRRSQESGLSAVPVMDLTIETILRCRPVYSQKGSKDCRVVITVFYSGFMFQWFPLLGASLVLSCLCVSLSAAGS